MPSPSGHDRKKTTKSFLVWCEKPFKVLSHAHKTAKAVLCCQRKLTDEGELFSDRFVNRPYGTPNTWVQSVGVGILDDPRKTFPQSPSVTAPFTQGSL